MGKKRLFSLYDIEQFLREAGAERVNEKAVISFEQELESTLNGLLNEVEKYANYAGRTKLINGSDVRLLGSGRLTPRKHMAAKAKSDKTATVLAR
jgi:histone H3/H4